MLLAIEKREVRLLEPTILGEPQVYVLRMLVQEAATESAVKRKEDGIDPFRDQEVEHRRCQGYVAHEHKLVEIVDEQLGLAPAPGPELEHRSAPPKSGALLGDVNGLHTGRSRSFSSAASIRDRRASKSLRSIDSAVSARMRAPPAGLPLRAKLGTRARPRSAGVA